MDGQNFQLEKSHLQFTDNQEHLASQEAGRRRSLRWDEGGTSCIYLSEETRLSSWFWLLFICLNVLFPESSQGWRGPLSSTVVSYFVHLKITTQVFRFLFQ